MAIDLNIYFSKQICITCQVDYKWRPEERRQQGGGEAEGCEFFWHLTQKMLIYSV